jgi:hypothetical protein
VSYQVIRTLVYEYDTVEHMMSDMGHWKMPATGVSRPNSKMMIASSVTPLMSLIHVDFNLLDPDTWNRSERRAYVAGYCRADSGYDPEISDRYEEDEKRP